MFFFEIRIFHGEIFNLFSVIFAFDILWVIEINRFKNFSRDGWVLFVCIADKFDTDTLITLKFHWMTIGLLVEKLTGGGALYGTAQIRGLYAHFSKKSQNPVPYINPFSEMRIFTGFPKNLTFFPF